MGEPRSEPSMEDILASIKRIIADDTNAATAAVSRVEAVASGQEPVLRFTPPPLQVIKEQRGFVDDALTEDAEEPVTEEVLELTEPAEHSAQPAAPVDPGSAGITPPPPPVMAEEPLELGPAAAVAAHRAQHSSPILPTAGILSDDAAIASRQSLAALSAMVIKPEAGSDNTLEGLVREMLRPMMKEWLDQRLPELVERLVEREIARITGRQP